MTAKALSDIRRKLKVLNYAKEIGNVSKACRYYGISRETYYQWKRAYEKDGEKVLVNSKPCPYNLTIRVPEETEKLIIYLRQNYHLGQQRISWHLEHYHDIKVSSSGVYSVLCRDGLNRLPKNQRKRSMKKLAMKNKCLDIEYKLMLSFLTSLIIQVKRSDAINIPLLTMQPEPWLKK